MTKETNRKNRTSTKADKERTGTTEWLFALVKDSEFIKRKNIIYATLH